MPGVSGNCWALAQAAGHARPYRLQHLLSGAVWDEDAVRDHVRGFVARHLGEGGVLIFDETGDLKKGTCTAGAGRQYAGTAGRIENAIVAVYATYATAAGHALVDRELYVQEQWFADPERMAKAGFEHDHAFAPKPQLAKAQTERAPAAGLAPAWATGDEVYGRSSELREVFEAHGIGYVFAVGCDHTLTTSGRVRMRADQALHLVEPRGWNRRSCGNGSKGRRLYDWAWIATASERHQLLIRRSISTGELAYYLAYVPAHYVASLTDLARSPARGGQSKTTFKTPTRPSDSTAPRCAATGRGNGTPPSPWPPTRCWPSNPRWPKPLIPHPFYPTTSTRRRQPTAAKQQ
jgi:SRSO17 transposase